MMFKKWIGTSRFVYNRALKDTKNGEQINFFSLRNKFVTKKNNTLVNDWELETPKDIRAEAIKDMTKAFNVAMINLKNNNISKFNLNYRSKKKESSISIPASAIKLSDKKIYMYTTYMKDPLKISKDKCISNLKIEHTCRLKNDNGKWFLFVPVKTSFDNKLAEKEACSLDPGTRKFQTIYSEDSVLKIGIKKEVIEKIKNKIKNYQSLRSKKNIKKSKYNKKNNKIQFKLKNLVDELHYQTISYLVKTFQTIFIPKFESQELIKVNKSKKFRNDLLSLRHYTFKERLLEKSKSKKGCYVRVCTEEFTSKTCSACGNIDYNLKSKEIYECKNCNMVLDRDVNGARNIFIKNILEI